MIRDWLVMEHHRVEIVTDGAEAQNMLKVYEYDILILDWELPHITGIEILKEFRSRGGTTPVLVLTGKGTIDDKETGFNAGADDYLTKPFHGKELTARLRALLRRPEGYVGDLLKFAHLTLDHQNFQV